MAARTTPTTPTTPTAAAASAPEPRSDVALVHHWLVTRRGGEKCLDALSSLLPGASLYTLVHDEQRCAAPREVATLQTSALQRLPGWRRHFRLWAPAFSRLYAGLDVSAHAYVVSSDASLAKAVVKAPGARHVCYCYSPVRWAFDQRETYLAGSLPALARPLARVALARIAAADRRAATAVDHFLTVSEHVAERIRRAYGREAQVVHPPVDTDFFTPGTPDDEPPLPALTRAPWASGVRPYLLLGQAVSYKRFELAVDACRVLDRPLVVAGAGPRWGALRRRAGPRTVFVPSPDDQTVRALYRGCRALLFPGEEDFGLVPVEAMACGRPVVALGLGGAAETVQDGTTGILVPAPGCDAFRDGILRLEREQSGLSSGAMLERARLFSLESHLRSMKAALVAAGVPVN
ncbi:MAG: glycosyltransferase family 4 protein [Planctomycetota bacterium]|nr:MAG: glycosyltransferase family 4 protein [Planctomycetota bacterium]